MPTDYATTNTTPAEPPDPGFTARHWWLKPTIDFSVGMSAGSYPRTPIAPGSEPRSQVGLVFPR